jgi:hypothetical protein
LNLVKRIPGQLPPETFTNFGPSWQPLKPHAGFPVPSLSNQLSVVDPQIVKGLPDEHTVEETWLSNTGEEMDLVSKAPADREEEPTADSELETDDVLSLGDKDRQVLVTESPLMRIFNVLTSERVIRAAVKELREQMGCSGDS